LIFDREETLKPFFIKILILYKFLERKGLVCFVWLTSVYKAKEKGAVISEYLLIRIEYDGLTWKSPKCYWTKKQIEPFRIDP